MIFHPALVNEERKILFLDLKKKKKTRYFENFAKDRDLVTLSLITKADFIQSLGYIPRVRIQARITRPGMKYSFLSIHLRLPSRIRFLVPCN